MIRLKIIFFTIICNFLISCHNQKGIEITKQDNIPHFSEDSLFETYSSYVSDIIDKRLKQENDIYLKKEELWKLYKKDIINLYNDSIDTINREFSLMKYTMIFEQVYTTSNRKNMDYYCKVRFERYSENQNKVSFFLAEPEKTLDSRYLFFKEDKIETIEKFNCIEMRKLKGDCSFDDCLDTKKNNRRNFIDYNNFLTKNKYKETRTSINTKLGNMDYSCSSETLVLDEQIDDDIFSIVRYNDLTGKPFYDLIYSFIVSRKLGIIGFISTEAESGHYHFYLLKYSSDKI